MAYVYFIQEGDDGPIKIGLHASPRQRLAAYQRANPKPLRLVATVRGSRHTLDAIEKQHAASALGISDGWFRFTTSLRNYVADLGRADLNDSEPTRTHKMNAFTLPRWAMDKLTELSESWGLSKSETIARLLVRPPANPPKLPEDS